MDRATQASDTALPDLRIIKVGGGYISEPILQQAYRAEDGSVEWRTIPVEWVSYAEYQEAREGR